MSEQPSSRQALDPSPSAQARKADSKKSDSQLRLVRLEDVVIPEHAEPSDNHPTIISKNKNLLNEGVMPAPVHSSPESLAGQNLRGQRLAHFELIEPIGVGGMAAVLRARDTQLDRFVALKILPPEMAEDPENVKRFHQEARAAAKLDHENIARVFFCGEDKRLHFIAFEFVEGDNLRVLLERRRRLPVAEAVLYILQIATGLEHAASRGVVHRDIKPSNIIISSNGRAKLVDMGLARSLEAHGQQALTQSGVTLGTFDYISPEQALEPREADSRSDIYSLGCTFYHMLTGQAPVPEGTAAKKLHHHHHVPPIDPRQLNPDIPDEVAAILMRMMAKDVKNRYQRPVHLVQHLRQVAHKVGAGADVPEGVLFLDAPLPGAPRLHPLLTASLAVLGLGILLLLLSLAPQDKHHGSQPPGFPQVAEFPPSAKENFPGTKNPTTVPLRSGVVTTGKQLAHALEDKQRGEEPILLNLDISLPDTGLVLRGDKLRGEGAGKLVLQSSDPQEPATFHFQYQPSSDGDPREWLAGLTVEGGEVEFRHLRFEIKSSITPTIPVAMIAARGASKVRFIGCTFAQKEVPIRPFISSRKSRIPVASVLVDNFTGDVRVKPDVHFEECYWEPGQAGVALYGPVKVQARNCAFKPQGALFHLRGDSRNLGTDLTLVRCSAFVSQGPAVRLDDTHGCRLKVTHCIFSCPDVVGTDRDEPQFIRQTDAAEPLVQYVGMRNCFHNLNALWVWPGENGGVPRIKANLEDFALNGGGDTDSSLLATSPWAAADPLQKGLKPGEAFRLRDNLMEVRSQDGKAVGVETCAWGPMEPLPSLPTNAVPVTEIKLKPNEIIIDPDAKENTKVVYQSLTMAWPFTKPGDVLLLKQGKKSREIEIKTQIFDDPNGFLTLKPYPEPGNQPVLVLAEKTQDPDAALFRLFDGKLAFENLEFLLEPEQPGYNSQSIVALAGHGMVTFKNCAMTLRQPDRRVPLRVVTFLNPDDVMKMPMAPSRAMAQVHLTDCLVRGEGDLIVVRGSRPFELKMENSMAVLAGSVLQVQGGSKDVPMDMPIQVKMNKVTTLLTEPLILLRGGKNARTLGLTRCDPIQKCLFVGLAEKPLLTLDNLDATEDTLRQYLDWKGSENVQVNIDPILEIYRPEEAFPSLVLQAEAWRRMEPDVRLLPARFQIPSKTRSLSQMTLDHFNKAKMEFREELAPFGATLEAEMLPRLNWK